MANIKISLIGAGSGCFSIGLIRDLCLSKNLANSTISLMDINNERLDAVYDLACRYSQELGAGLRIEKTMDRVTSLTGADFVINTALTAPHSRLQEGWQIAQRHGFRFAGSYHIMYDEAFWVNFYQFKFFESLTEDILKYCPKAWHLMVANPVVAGTTHLQRKYPEAKMVGLCHGYAMMHWLAKLMKLEKNSLNYEIPGVNHFVWLTRAFAGGEDFFKIMDQLIDNPGDERWAKGLSKAMTPSRLDFYKKHGVIGIGDTMSWTGACWPWWYHQDEQVEAQFDNYPPMNGWNSYFTSVLDNAALVQRIAADVSQPVSKQFPDFFTDELMIPLIEAIACDIPKVLIVNMLNRNHLVPGIPEDFEVEVPALCSGRGIQGIQTAPLPKHIIAHTLRDRVSPVEMELEAFNHGRKDFLEELILMDKWAPSLEATRSFLDEILRLPYHREMAKHYR